MTSDPTQETQQGSSSGESMETVRELANISMGAAGANLGLILNHEVDVPTPTVEKFDSIAAMLEPMTGEAKVVVTTRYTQGLSYQTAFVLKTEDAQWLSDSMMGGTAGESEPGVLNDIQHSAVVEMFSQMMTASATGLSSVIAETVDITTPEVADYSAELLATTFAEGASQPVVAIRFDLGVGDARKIQVIQLMMAAEADSQVTKLMSVKPDRGISPGIPADDDASAAVSDKDLEELLGMTSVPAQGGSSGASGAANDDLAALMGGMSGGGGAGRSVGPSPVMSETVNPVTVQPVQFSSFDEQPAVYGEYNKNLGLVLDVSLNLTVQLGSTELSIKQILELTRGSVIELDRIAGEPVDLLANGKLIAKGEVVVIEDNFGLRITSIVSPQDRLRGLTGHGK